MNELAREEDVKEVQGATNERGKLTRRRISLTFVQDSTPKRKFNELINAINSMRGVILLMQ